MRNFLLALLLAAPAAAGDFVTLPGATTKYIFIDGVNAPGGVSRFDIRNQYFLFGTTTPRAGFSPRVVSSGTVVIQSTSATAAYNPLVIYNNAGTELLRVQQNGRVGISSSVPTATFSVGGTIAATGVSINGVSGTSLDCATGQTVDDPTYNNGVLTAGSCTSGFASLNSTNTWSAQQTFLNNVNISTSVNGINGISEPWIVWLTTKPAGTGGDTISTAWQSEKVNLEFIDTHNYGSLAYSGVGSTMSFTGAGSTGIWRCQFCVTQQHGPTGWRARWRESSTNTVIAYTASGYNESGGIGKNITECGWARFTSTASTTYILERNTNGTSSGANAANVAGAYEIYTQVSCKMER